MGSFIKSKKGIAALAALVVVGASCFGAYAFFSAGGTGTATATVSNPQSVTLVGTITGPLSPGGAAASVSVEVINSNPAAQFVNSIQLASVQIDQSSTAYKDSNPAQYALWDACDFTAGSPDPGSDPAFSMTDIPVGLTLAASGGHTTVTGSIQMNDTGVVQNDCGGAPLLLSFTSN